MKTSFDIPAAALKGQADPKVFATVLRKKLCDAAFDATGRQDAVASASVHAEDVEKIMAEVLEEDYRIRYGSRFVPSGPYGTTPWTDTYRQRIMRNYGRAQYIEGNSIMSDAGFTIDEYSIKVHMYGVRTGWAWHEMEAAREAGVPLDSSSLAAARQAIEFTRDELILIGDANLEKSGLIETGFVNDRRVPVQVAANGNWASATADQIFEDVRDAIAEFRQTTERRHMATTLLLPESQYTLMESLPFGDNRDHTLRSYILANIPELREIELLPQLAAAGLGGLDRALLYERSANVVRAVMPMSMRPLAPYNTPLMTEYYMVERMAGVEWVRPYAGLYIDGI